MSTGRDVMEAAANAALARYLQATGDGTPRRIAERAYRDHILRAWANTAVKAAAIDKQHTERWAPLEQALAGVTRG